MTDKDTVEALTQAAIHLFAEHGFDGTSVKQIADRAGVNVSLVSYHFGGKEGLLKTCMENFGKQRLAVSQRVLEPPSSIEELRVRLTLFIEDMWVTHMEQPDLCKILHREKEFGMEVAQDIFKNTFLKSFETLVVFIKTAQTRGLVKQQLDPFALAGFVYGSMMSVAQSDKIGEKFFGRTLKNKKERDRMIDELLDCLLNGFAVKS
jgi:AcrR family transcriptional regulator